MQLRTYSISDVLKLSNTTFFIPPFQRAYAWEKKELDRYFSDIDRLITSELNPDERDKQEHFFGTLVFKNEKDGFADRYLVIDGQQRLTTSLIFYIALRDLEPDANIRESLTKLYLVDSSSPYEQEIKLKQVTSDWEAYKALVLGEEPIKGKITNAYNQFKRLIRDRMVGNPKITTIEYMTALSRLNVATILLDERPYKGEDPQIIFETLNSLGKPLTLADLIRNYILLGMHSDKQTYIYDEVWLPKIEQPLEAVGEEYTSRFFRDYLQCKDKKPYKVVSDNNTKELYAQFKDFVELTFASKEDFIKDIQTYVPCYMSIINPNAHLISPDPATDKVIKELLQNIFFDIKGNAFIPVVMELLHMHRAKEPAITISNDQLIECLKTIRTYLIRRRVLRLSQAENKNIPTLTDYLPSIATGQTSLVKILSDLFYQLRLPNDKEIRETLGRISFYKEVRDYNKFILGKMEETQSKVSVPYRDKDITIEHIMPQAITPAWQQELGADWEETHDELLHNIGNLILTEFNGEMSNKTFQEKKESLHTSNLHYRLSILQHATWTRADILQHRDEMIDLFLKTFPLPDEYQYRNNYRNSRESQVGDTFHPLEDDPRLLTKSKPKAIVIFGESFTVRSWREVLLTFFKQIIELEPATTELFFKNQLETFEKSNALVRWRDLSEAISQQSNPEYKRWFKTLDNQFCEHMKTIDPDCIFVYVNQSGYAIADRIARAMRLLDLDSEDVFFKL